MPLDYTHQHDSTSILQAPGVSAPISPGAQTVSLLGPFELTHEDVTGAFISVVEVPASAIVVSVPVRVTAQLDESISVTVAIGSTSNPEDNHSIATYSNVQNETAFWGADVSVPSVAVPKIGFAITAADLVVALDAEGGTPTEGSVAIYALIATPSE